MIEVSNKRDVVENYHFLSADSKRFTALAIADVHTPKCLAISAIGIPIS